MGSKRHVIAAILIFLLGLAALALLAKAQGTKSTGLQTNSKPDSRW